VLKSDEGDFEWSPDPQWFVEDETFAALLDTIRALPERRQRRIALLLGRLEEDLHEIAEEIARARS
jgi:hypothetical protein